MDVSQKPDPSTVPPSKQPPPVPLEDQDEISLVDILKFLRRQFWLISGITLAVMLIGAGTSVLTSPQARRELLLQLKLPPEMRMNTVIAADVLVMQDEIVQAGNLALGSDFPRAVMSEESSPVSAVLSEANESDHDRFRMVITSADPSNLEAAEQVALTTLQEAASEVAESYLDPELTRLDFGIRRTQAKIARLESRLPAPDALAGGDSVNVSSFLQWQQQAQQQTLIAEEFGQLADYELEREGLASLKTREEPLASFSVLTATQTLESGSLLQRLVLSAIAGLMLGVFVALIVDQLPRLKATWSQLDQ